ncbi:MAG: hypothetical protein AAF153_02565 [Pseudomonadota bacterium]
MREAGFANSTEILNILLKAGAIVTDSVLDGFIKNGNIEATQILLDSGLQKNGTYIFDKNLYWWVQSTDNADMIDFLADKGANFTNSDILWRAVDRDNIQVTKALIKHGADVIAHDPLYEAHSMAMVQLLIDAGADVTKSGVVANFAYRNNLEAVTKLVELGANLDNHDPLARAGEGNSTQMLNYL